ncbi:MAG TPA: hypothetical protein VF735_04910 [Pyrinomonadaceae bacterium]|jgi:hypothetical protein
MKTRIFNLLLPLLIVSVYYAMILATAQAQAPPPPPPPPPAKDYFPDKWDEYTSQDGKFRIRFPKEPREDVTPSGRFEQHSLEYKGLLTYRVSYVDYKTPIDDPQKIDDLLQGLKTAALAPLKEKGLVVKAERRIAVDGHQGIFLHLEVQDKEVVRVLWVVADTRLYTITALSRKGRPQELEGKDDFEKVAMGFINSFHLSP